MAAALEVCTLSYRVRAWEAILVPRPTAVMTLHEAGGASFRIDDVSLVLGVLSATLPPGAWAFDPATGRWSIAEEAIDHAGRVLNALFDLDVNDSARVGRAA